MKPILALALTIGFICWNANWVQADHHDHHAHQHGHQDKSKNVSMAWKFSRILHKKILAPPLEHFSLSTRYIRSLQGAEGEFDLLFRQIKPRGYEILTFTYWILL